MKRSAQRSQDRDFDDAHAGDREQPEMTLREWLQEDDRRGPSRPRPESRNADTRDYGREPRVPAAEDLDRARWRRERDEDERPRRDRARFAPPPQAPAQPRRDDTRVADIVQSAMRKFETRVERGEQRTVEALESVAQWMRRSQADRARDGEVFSAIFDQLSTLDEKITAQAEAPAIAPEFDRRMNALAARLEGLEAAPRPPLAPRAPSPAPTARAASPSPEPAPRSLIASLRNFGVDSTPAVAPASSPAAPAQTPRDADALRADLRRASENLAAMRRRPPEPAKTPEPAKAPERPSADEIAGLRADVSAMARCVADLAPRNSVVALEGALRDLSERVGAMNEPDPRLALVAPMAASVAELRDAVRAQNAAGVAAALDKDIGALGRKVDALAATAVDRVAFEGIRRQIEETRLSLDGALARIAPHERLERQIGALADKIDQLAVSPRPDAEAKHVLSALGDLRDSVERNAPVAVLASIEAKLESLAARIDKEMSQPKRAAILDMRAIDGLAERIESVRQSVESRPPAADPAKVEAALRELSEKLDRRPNPTLDIKPLEAALTNLSQRPIHLDASPLGDAIRGLNAKLDERPAPDSSAFEAMLGALSQRIDSLDTRGIEANLAALNQRSAAGPDLGALGDALRDIHAKLDERPAALADLSPLTDAVRRIDAKLDGSAQGLPPAMESALGALARRLDSIDAKTDDSRGLAAEIARIGAKIDAAASATAAPDLSGLENLLHDLGAKIDGQSTLALDIHDMQSRQAQALLDSPRAEGASAAALEAIWRRIDEILSQQAQPASLGGELAGLHDRLDAIDASLRPQSGAEDALRDLASQMDEQRQALQALLDASGAGPRALLAKLSELRVAQTQGDGATQERLARVSEVLEKLVDRIDRIELDAGAPPPASQGQTWTDKAEPMFAPPQRADAEPAAPAAHQVAQAPARPSASDESIDKPLGGAPAPARGPRALAADGKPDYIAAARRAAQTALAETARDKAAAKAAPQAAPVGAAAPAVALKVNESIDIAKQFFAQRRRPILLGLGVIVLLSMVAFAGTRLASTFIKSSEADAPGPVVSDAGPAPSPIALASPTPAIDTAPVGSIAPAPLPSAAPSPIFVAPNAALIAAIPAWAPQPLRDALLLGDPAAQYELASRYLDGRGTLRDLPAGAKWLQEASAQGLAPAQYRLAALYEKGLGVFKDLTLAKVLYLKAANAGNARAMHNLGVLSAESAADSKPDFVAAADWFRRAAKYGVKDSQFNLGILETRGLGGPQDLKQAWLHFSLAANQGDLDAAKKRDEVAAKLDAPGLDAARQLLANYKIVAPPAASNEVPAPSGGWDGKPTASASPATVPSPAASPRAAKI